LESIFPAPITIFINSREPRKIITSDYKNTLSKDSNLKDIPQLISNGLKVFDDLSFVKDLELLRSKSIIEATEVNNGIVPNFITMSEDEKEFYIKFKPENGTMSLRSGYYKILPTPEDILNIGNKPKTYYMREPKLEDWETNVLYCAGVSDPVIYKYKCNVGPLLNRLAVCHNLTKDKVYSLYTYDKNILFKRLDERIIYISKAEFVNDKEFKTSTKEVLWFIW
jgi:hypothetical protein